MPSCHRATKIQNLESFCDSESLDERLSTFPHAFSYARKVASSQSALFGFIGLRFDCGWQRT